MSTTKEPTKHACVLHFTDGRTVCGHVTEAKFIVHTHEATEGFNTGGIEQVDFGIDLVSDTVWLRSRKVVHGSLAVHHDKIIFIASDGIETIDRRNIKSINFLEGGKEGQQ